MTILKKIEISRHTYIRYFIVVVNLHLQCSINLLGSQVGWSQISYLHSYDSWGRSLKYFILIVHKSCLIFWWQLPTCQLHPLIILFLLNLRIMGERWLLSSDFWRLPYGDRRVSDWEACLVGQQVFRGRALGGGLKGWCWVSVGLRSTGAGVWNCVSRVDIWSILLGPERKFQSVMGVLEAKWEGVASELPLRGHWHGGEVPEGQQRRAHCPGAGADTDILQHHYSWCPG